MLAEIRGPRTINPSGVALFFKEKIEPAYPANSFFYSIEFQIRNIFFHNVLATNHKSIEHPANGQ